MIDVNTLIKNNIRYKEFIELADPKPFKDLFAFDSFDIVQVHCMEDIGDGEIAGFCGAFAWKDHSIQSLDGDSYNDTTIVLGYHKWNNVKDGIQNAIDIIVGNDW